MLVRSASNNSQILIHGNCYIDCPKIKCLVKRQNAAAGTAAGTVKAESFQFADLTFSVQYDTGHPFASCYNVAYKWVCQRPIALHHVEDALKFATKRLTVIIAVVLTLFPSYAILSVWPWQVY